MEDIKAPRARRSRMPLTQTRRSLEYRRPFQNCSEQAAASQILLKIGPRRSGFADGELPAKDAELKCILHFQRMKVGEGKWRVDCRQNGLGLSGICVRHVARHQKAAVRVASHPTLVRLFVPLDQDEIRQHPIAKNTPRSGLNVGPCYELISSPRLGRLLPFELSNRRKESTTLARRERSYLIKQFGSPHKGVDSSSGAHREPLRPHIDKTQ